MTGFEPATPSSRTKYSTKLSHTSTTFKIIAQKSSACQVFFEILLKFSRKSQTWLAGQCTGRGKSSGFLLVPVFFAGGASSADVPLLFIFKQNRLDLLCKQLIDFYQTLGHIFMYSRFADAKFFGCFSHSAFILDDVVCKFNRSFFDITPHIQCLPFCYLFLTELLNLV